MNFMNMLFYIIIIIYLLIYIDLVVSQAPLSCPPGTKWSESSLKCIQINDLDVMSSMHWLSEPPTTKCFNLNSQIKTDFSYCDEDFKNKQCLIWTIISTNNCDDIGDLNFERKISTYCDVVVFHFTPIYKGNVCTKHPSGVSNQYPRLQIIRKDIWGGRCFACFYKTLQESFPLSYNQTVDILIIQKIKENVFDGVQYVILSDLFTYMPYLSNSIQQIIVTISMTSNTLVDLVGRESENGWNMFASRKFLSSYASFNTIEEAAPYKLEARQFKSLFRYIGLNPAIGYYHHSFKKISEVSYIQNEKKFSEWKPLTQYKQYLNVRAEVPLYCTIPSEDMIELDKELQIWVNKEINVRCHPTRLAVPCIDNREYSAFVPCKQELMNKLAEDYAATKGWCNYNHPSADIPMIDHVDPEAVISFQKSYMSPETKKVRLAFLFTVYSDAKHVKRLISRLYDLNHYYLIHIDPVGSKPEFETEIRQEILNKYKDNKNVYIAKSIPIVYGASTATMLLTQTMAWYYRKTTGWNYFIPVTGSDYPLIPLPRLELMLSHQLYITKNPMPFVMAWTPGTSTHIFRLSMTYPNEFKLDSEVHQSIQAVMKERGRPLGSNPMEYRASNFGPPLFCENQQSFYHLDNRRNKSNIRLDTMWLFPRDTYPGKGRAYANEDRNHALLPIDNEWRVWQKSDPATTGIYDLRTIEYITESTEGRKYYHFFKHMLLGSEEHYYVSLLYNWNRTKGFVMTLSSEVVWNTWELGLWEQAPGFQTHTHFLSFGELDLIKGFAKRGMIFARKFSSDKTGKLLNFIDDYIHFNSSTDAGIWWPGYFEVDVTSPGRTWVQKYKNGSHRKKRQNS
jgi:hypothetical protein